MRSMTRRQEQLLETGPMQTLAGISVERHPKKMIGQRFGRILFTLDENPPPRPDGFCREGGAQFFIERAHPLRPRFFADAVLSF